MPMQARPPRLPDVAMAKKVKKVQWVDASLYGRVLAGDTIADLLGDESILLQEPYITHTELPADANGSHEFVRTEVSQRVTLQSRTGDDDALPYYVDKVLFRHDAGLYFLAEGDMQLLERALRILAMEGVGTDRNVGLGFFDYAADSITLDLPGDATHQVALSLFIPESREQLQELLDGDDVAYDFTRRGGWITTHPYTTLRKNAIHAFTPGSVFRLPEQQQGMTIGRLFDLRPDVGPMAPGHPVWRSGKAMMLPIK